MIPLSVLDLSVVTTGTKPAAALRNSIDLARHVDGLGYVRYWLAEHHNLASVASPAPDLMIGQIAAVTKNIRVGSGGVMLPNHAPLVVAERFKMLEALFPGRIDLGLGRAPGPDGATAPELRSRLESRGITLVSVEDEWVGEVDRIIFEELAAGRVVRNSQRKLKTLITELAKQRVQAVVLGCTELVMAVDVRANVLPVYDTTAIHARACVEWMLADEEAARAAA